MRREASPPISFDDPLRASASHDPLQVEETAPFSSRPTRRGFRGAASEQADVAAGEWDNYKTSIMQRFSSTGTITVSTTFDILSKEPKGRGKSVTAAHLEELEDPGRESREEVKIISQREYVTRLKELNEEISQAWLNNERVAALRLSIKVARLLCDTSVPQFYPILFVLVTDVMDTVGNLVWNRIKKKSEIDEAGNLISVLPVNFTSDDVRQEAKDTCNNWFYKIGLIRELLPRIYLELAILRCLQFLEKDLPISSFQRLTMMMRGLADPLASSYARLYLARRSQALIPFETSQPEPVKKYAAVMSFLELPLPSTIPHSPRGFLVNSLKDYLMLFRRVIAGEFDTKILKAGVDRRLYLTLVEPVIEWIVYCIFKSANQEEISRVLEAFGDTHLNSLAGDAASKVGQDPVSIVVNCLLRNLPATFIGNNALSMSRIVRSSQDISMPQFVNYKLLGMKLCECSPPREYRITVLNDVWRVVMKYSDLAEYLSVADIFVEYILQNCSEVELCVMLRDIMKHLKKSEASDGVLATLESIVFKLVTHYTDLGHVLTLDYFVDILDVFYGDTRISVHKRILVSVSRSNQRLQDPVTRHFIFEAAKLLHDSLDSLSSDDDRRQITRLVVRCVQLVDFGRDLEQHLSFLVDCRGAFADMDPLMVTVIHASNRLAMTTLRMVKGSHVKRTLEFVKACITFNEITIPSINSIVTRINIFLETAEVALMNMLPGHAEGLIKSAITCLQDVSYDDDFWKGGETEEGIAIFLLKLAGFLVVVPGNPELGAFYLVNGLLNVLDTCPRMITGTRKLRVLCCLLFSIVALAQQHLPYHIPKINSNDVLYYGDSEYQQNLQSLLEVLVEKIVAACNEIVDPNQKGNQALDACNALRLAFEVNDKAAICTNLVQSASAILMSSTILSGTLEASKRRGLPVKG